MNTLTVGARVGTSSLRRQAQLRHHRPDIEAVDLRGNVDTRLKKLDAGEFDAIVLAVAGVNRLGMANRITQLIDAEIDAARSRTRRFGDRNSRERRRNFSLGRCTRSRGDPRMRHRRTRSLA